MRYTSNGELVGVHLTSGEVAETSSHGVEWTGGEVPVPVTNSGDRLPLDTGFLLGTAQRDLENT
jgi:hypothetical protein